MDLNINDYIDFNKLFLDLFEYHENELIEEQYQAKHFKDILNFKNHYINDFILLDDECDYSDNQLVFWFGHDFNDANESCNQSTTATFIIVYDTILSEFTSCDYEQG